MKKMLDLRFAWVVGLMGFVQGAVGQSNGTPANADRDIVSSVATYPTDLRSAVLDVAQYPQVLVKLERIQARSSQSFQDLISGYPREEQAKFYELSRYPDRLNLLVRDGKKSTEQAQRLLGDVPKESQSSILDVYENHYNDLVKIHTIYQSSEDALQETISGYPQQVQNDFKKVVSKPEVMNLLTENIDLTTSLGEDYRANPNGVIEQLDSLNNQQQKDFAEYKKEAENNPEMQQEMRNAADRFSSSYAQSDSPVDSYLENQAPAYSNSAPVVNNYYNYNPYPYWFSYPYWYTTPIWYPVPYYYNTGFYYGRGGRIVVWGYPSFAYTNWFFSFGYRRYPHLYNSYHSYYHGYYGGYAGGRGGYRGYHSPRYDGSRMNRSNSYYQGGRGTYSGSGNRSTYSGSGNRSTYSGGGNRSTVSGGGNRSTISGSGNRYNRTSFSRNQTMANNNRTLMSASRNSSVNQNWVRSNSGGSRTSIPMHQNTVRPSNSFGGGQIRHSSSGSFSRQPSSGGSRGGFSGSRGGGGGGRSGGGGGGRRGR